MALPTLPTTYASVEWGLVTAIEIREFGTGSFVSIGEIRDEPSIQIVPLSNKGDPTNTDIVFAVKYVFTFRGFQTAKTGQLALMAGTSGTGLYETNAEVKFTFASGRTLTIGAATGYTLRILAEYNAGGDNEPQYITYSGECTEPFVSGVAGKFSA